MTIQIITRRIAAGEYSVSLKGAPAATNRRVSVSRVHFWDGPGWIASPDWEPTRSTGPLPTKREAVENARCMLEGAEIVRRTLETA